MKIDVQDILDKVRDLPDWFSSLERDQQIAYGCIGVGILLIIIGLILV